MLTTKTAKKFFERCQKGDRPRLPRDVARCLCMPVGEIHYLIDHARSFDYGNTLETKAKRLVQMGLFDSQYNLTTLGREYYDEKAKEAISSKI